MQKLILELGSSIAFSIEKKHAYLLSQTAEWFECSGEI